MHVCITQEKDTLTAEIIGRLDTTTTPEVAEVLDAPLENCARCILDMAKMDYISSAGLRLLLLLHKRMESSGGKLLLRHIQPGVLDILGMTGFTSFLAIE